VRRLSDIYRHTFLNVPFNASFISPLRPSMPPAFPPSPSDPIAFKTHNSSVPNRASFKRLYRKRPGGHFSLHLGTWSPGHFRYSTSVYGEESIIAPNTMQHAARGWIIVRMARNPLGAVAGPLLASV